MSITQKHWFDRPGHQIEAYVTEMLEDLYYGEARVSTDYEDYHDSTDIFVKDIPIDITISPDKRFVHHIETIQYEGITLHVGVRYYNGHHRLKKRVLVLHFDTYWQDNIELICDMIEDNFDRDIFNQLLKLYP